MPTAADVPVLLVQGICSRSTVFQRGPSGPGLASCLGKGLRPQFFEPFELTSPGPCSFDTLALQALPRVWHRVSRDAGRPVPVIGYSMGGMMSLLAQARGLISAPVIATVAAPFRFGTIPLYPVLMRHALRIATAAGARRIPVKLLGRLLCWYFSFGRRGGSWRQTSVFHGFIRTAGVDVSVALLRQATHWVTTGNFCDAEGRQTYLSDLVHVRCPTLFLAGEYDHIAPLDAVQAGRAAISSADRQLTVFPGATHLDFVSAARVEMVGAFLNAWFSTGARRQALQPSFPNRHQQALNAGQEAVVSGKPAGDFPSRQ